MKHIKMISLEEMSDVLFLRNNIDPKKNNS